MTEVELVKIDDDNYHIMLEWRNYYYDKFKQKRLFTREEHDFWYNNVYKEKAKRSKEVMYLVRTGDKYVGSFGLTEVTEDSAEICRVVVNPVYEGSGYMKKAMALLVTRAREIGLERLHLDVLRSNKKAHDFYMRLEFQEYKKDKDSIYMELWLYH